MTPTDLPHGAARLTFYLRSPGPRPGTSTYAPLSHHAENSAGDLYTDHIPAVGDLVTLPGTKQLTFRVVDRDWAWPVRGSLAWGVRSLHQAESGPMLQIIVEAAPGGPFADEYDNSDEESA